MQEKQAGERGRSWSLCEGAVLVNKCNSEDTEKVVRKSEGS